VARNVARLVQPPAPDREEIRPWTDAEAGAFLSTARAHRLHALFVVALGLGLRRGELLGLRWVDVDFATGQLRVWRTLQRVKGDGVVYGPPKSRRSRRVLTMPGVVAAAVRKHRKRQDAERADAGEAWTDTSLVFTTATGRHVEPRNLNTVFGRLVVRAGVRPIRLESRPGARFRCCHRSVSPDRSPNPPCRLPVYSELGITGIMPSPGLCRVHRSGWVLCLLREDVHGELLGIIRGLRGRRAACRVGGSGRGRFPVVWCGPAPAP
jgi:integrase